jgi:hypothetical protein
MHIPLVLLPPWRGKVGPPTLALPHHQGGGNPEGRIFSSNRLSWSVLSARAGQDGVVHSPV